MHVEHAAHHTTPHVLPSPPNHLPGKFARIPARYSEDLYRAIRWMLNIDVRGPTTTAVACCCSGPTQSSLAPPTHPQQSKRPTVEELDRLPRPKAVTRETGLALREYQVSSALAAKQREVKAREEELEKREAAAAAAEARMREREAALTARVAEVRSTEGGAEGRYAPTRLPLPPLPPLAIPCWRLLLARVLGHDGTPPPPAHQHDLGALA